MNMTPKKIMAKFLAVPLYSTSGIISLFALLFVIPGGIALVAALCFCWVADRLTSGSVEPDYPTIEEYGEHIVNMTNIEMWHDFFHEEDDDAED